MKKVIIISVLATLATVSTVFGAAYAAGTIKLMVNGKTISTDTAPRMINGRVMVPISVVSKELGADVSWNQKSQTVSVNSMGIPYQDVWNETFDGEASLFTIGRINNTVQVFMSGMDTGDEGLLKQSTSGMDTNLLKQQHFSMGPTMLNTQIVDVRTIKKSEKYQVRVAIQTWLDETTLDYWDLTIAPAPAVQEGNTITTGGKMDYVVTKLEKVKSEIVDVHRVFPGLTVDFKK